MLKRLRELTCASDVKTRQFTYFFSFASIVLELNGSLDSLLQIVRRNSPCAILMQSESIVRRRSLVGIVAVLLIADFRLAPRAVIVREVDVQVRVRDEPIVDLAPVHGVLPICKTRGKRFLGVGAKVWTAWAAKGGNLVFPARGQSALYLGRRKCSREAKKAEAGDDCRLHA